MSSTQICEALHRGTPDIRGWSSVSTAEAKTRWLAGRLPLEAIGFMIRRVHAAGWLNRCALTMALFPFNCSCKSSQLLLTVGGGEVYDVYLMSLKGIKQLAGNTTAIPFFVLAESNFFFFFPSNNIGSNRRSSVQLGGTLTCGAEESHHQLYY